MLSRKGITPSAGRHGMAPRVTDEATGVASVDQVGAAPDDPRPPREGAFGRSLMPGGRFDSSLTRVQPVMITSSTSRDEVPERRWVSALLALGSRSDELDLQAADGWTGESDESHRRSSSKCSPPQPTSSTPGSQSESDVLAEGREEAQDVF